MTDSPQTDILHGVQLGPGGEAQIDPALTRPLCDLALALQDRLPLPVDVEHVLAAALLAVREERLPRGARLAADDERLLAVLAPYVQRVFDQHDGQLGED